MNEASRVGCMFCWIGARDEEWNSIPDQGAVSSCFGARGAGHSFRIWPHLARLLYHPEQKHLPVSCHTKFAHRCRDIFRLLFSPDRLYMGCSDCGIRGCLHRVVWSGYRRFGGTWCLHVCGRRIITADLRAERWTRIRHKQGCGRWKNVGLY